MKIAEQFLAAYAGAEPWKLDHDGAMRCFEMEEVLRAGDLAYEFVSFIDAAWQDRVAAGEVPYVEEDDRQIGEFYRTWVEISERNLAEMNKLIEAGYEVQGADGFLLHLEEARSLVEARALEAAMRPIEEILPLARGNPRPERYGR